MTAKFVPTWKDKEGNRFFRLALHFVFDKWEDAFEWQADQFLFYIPLGLTMAGIVELNVSDEGRADIDHKIGDHPILGALAVIGGPRMEAA